MYVMETNHYRKYRAYTLHHMSQSEFRAATETARFQVGQDFAPVTGQHAHRWVRDGGHHTTPLWLDTYDNRIRFAKEGC